MAHNSEAAPQDETRSLLVSVWLGFALAVADVTVSDRSGDVAISSTWLERKDSPERIGVTPSDLDRLALVAPGGHTTLRAAIERRAREEAFA